MPQIDIYGLSAMRMDAQGNAYFDNNAPTPDVTGAVSENSGDATLTVGETVVYDGESYTYLGSIGEDVLDGSYVLYGLFLQDADGDWFYAAVDPDAAFDTSTEPVVPDQRPVAACFMAGTAFATPEGERLVETLSQGDLVLAADGQTRPIKWMWRQTVTTIFADPLRSLPIRIAAGALGDNLPECDLCVSPDHALLIDGLLVHADALVNGTSVTRMTGLPESFVYYHIEPEDHALVLAEGVAAETFVDNVTRRRFDNWADYEARFGDEPAVDELDLPRVKSARMLPRTIRARLAERAVELGLASALAA